MASRTDNSVLVALDDLRRIESERVADEAERAADERRRQEQEEAHLRVIQEEARLRVIQEEARLHAMLEEMRRHSEERARLEATLGVAAERNQALSTELIGLRMRLEVLSATPVGPLSAEPPPRRARWPAALLVGVAALLALAFLVGHLAELRERGLYGSSRPALKEPAASVDFRTLAESGEPNLAPTATVERRPLPPIRPPPSRHSPPSRSSPPNRPPRAPEKPLRLCIDDPLCGIGDR
jgi:hypothetical protein